MADTQRSIAQVATLLADNTTQAISPQDIRDFLETFRPGNGEIYVSSPVLHTFTTASTWEEATDGTFTLTADSVNWAQTQNGRLYYTGTADRIVHASMSFSLVADTNNITFRIGIGLDGTVLPASPVRRKIGTGADVGAAATQAITQISAGSYLVPMIYNEDDNTTTLTMSTGNLTVLDLPL